YFGYAYDLCITRNYASASTRPLLDFINERLTIHLNAGDNVIGRGDDAVISIESSKVSRQHANISVTATEVTIEDMGSKNGTFVGGERITSRRVLSDGDEISVGPARMMFRHQSANDSTVSDSAL